MLYAAATGLICAALWLRRDPHVRQRPRTLATTLDAHVRTHVFNRDVHKFGTSRNVVAMSADGILPTRNFREGQFEHAKAISGQTMAETILEDEGTCYACAIACKRE